MKKKILAFIFTTGVCCAQAQNINPENDMVVGGQTSPYYHGPVTHTDSLFTGWAIDVNLLGGILTQDYTAINQVTKYSTAVNNATISNAKFSSGVSYGADAELAYFFGRNTHFGVGTGVFYLYQQGNITMDNYHVEYQSTDNFKQTFRQVITADNPIKESLKISNFNIPLLLKYKKKLSRKFGFAADAGILVNLQEKYNYNTNASFDYEAVYKYNTESSGPPTFYDNSVKPGASDVLIEKVPYLTTHTAAQLQDYFSTLKSEGYNVGLGVKPNSNTGNVSYKAGSVGFLMRPSVSYYLSDNVALSLGVYYLYQSVNNNAPANYQITNKTGEYNSMTNSVTNAVNQSYGVSIGVRYMFTKKCEEMPEAPPIPTDDATVKTEEPAPPSPQPVAKTPESEEDEDESDEAISKPILFQTNKTVISPSSYPTLEAAAKKADKDKDVYIEINGYTDITGTATYNRALSKKRAQVVKNYLRKKGVDPKSLKTIGHGASSPAATNKTKAGRSQNRRVIMRVKKKVSE